MITSIKYEVYRKLIHFSVISIPILYLSVIENYFQIVIPILLLFLTSIFIEYLRNTKSKFSLVFHKYTKNLMRENEIKGEITGATWYIFSVLIIVTIFPKKIAILAIIFLAVGDTVAAIVGKSLPYIKYKNKSVFGSFIAFISILLITHLFGYKVFEPIVLFGALSAVIIELIPIRVNDNFSIPVFSSIIMFIISKISLL